MSIRLIADVVNQLGSPALYSNSLANRPPAGFGGRLFISSDTHEIYQDVITGWNLIADAGAGAGTLDSVTHNGNTTTWGINILGGDLTLQATQKLYVLGLANGGVLFPSSGSGLIDQDTTNFVWDNTNKYLGIGTNAPSAPFDIHSGSNVMQQLNSTGTNNSFLAFLNQDIGKWRIGNLYGGGNNDMVIYDTANGTYRAYFTNTGYTILPNSVIIGSSSRSSSYTLDVTGSGKFTAGLSLSTFTAGSVLFTGTGGLVSQNNSKFFWDDTTNTLGIGTATPTQISTFTTLEIRGATGGGIKIGKTATAQFNIQQDGSSAYFNNTANGNIYFYTNNIEAGRITNSQNLIIGTTSDTGDKLQVSGNATFSSNIAIGGAISSNTRLRIFGSDSGNTNNAIILYNSSPTILFQVRNDGVIFTGVISGSPYNNSVTGHSACISSSGVLGYLVSTRESKANIQPINNTDFINKLNPVQFNYRKKNDKTNTFTDELEESLTYGFIADEVEKVNKELVFYKSDGTLAGVEYNNMIAILTKSIQELNEKLVRNNIN